MLSKLSKSPDETWEPNYMLWLWNKVFDAEEIGRFSGVLFDL